MKCSTSVKRAPAPASITTRAWCTAGRAARRELHEVDRIRNLASGRDAHEDAARRKRVRKKRIAIVSVIARRAQQGERRLRCALEQCREIEDLESRRSSEIGEARREAAVDEHHAARTAERQEPRGEGGGIGLALRGRLEGEARDARVVEVFPVLVAPVRQSFRDQRFERALTPLRPRRTARRRRRAARRDALDGACRAHAAAVPSRSQS